MCRDSSWNHDYLVIFSARFIFASQCVQVISQIFMYINCYELLMVLHFKSIIC